MVRLVKGTGRQHIGDGPREDSPERTNRRSGAGHRARPRCPATALAANALAEDDDDRRVRPGLLNVEPHLDSVHLGHIGVRDHEIWRISFDRGHGLSAIGRADTVGAQPSEEACGTLAWWRVVLHQEYMRPGGGATSGPLRNTQNGPPSRAREAENRCTAWMPEEGLEPPTRGL